MRYLTFIAVLVIVMGISFTSPSFGGTLNMGVANLTDGHSEGDGDRCINDGWAIDLGYDFVTWEYSPKWSDGWLGLQLTPGALFTYSNYETAERERVGAPEFNQKNESALTLIGVAKPGIRIWRISAYKMFGVGVDYMQADDAFDVGHLKEGYGADIRIYKELSIGLNHRKFQRSDNGHYSYITGQISYKF